ncbi:hypothetical protein CMI41_01800 [Candidatus Pacearchaeota archaeon]|nr:hypothetical protein [Candidatus Pacearchaeota archaeon]|tara:strand:- start:15144 stop:15527 length:384 start_codon:yes stop_codon:yes gene_type:complete
MTNEDVRRTQESMKELGYNLKTIRRGAAILDRSGRSVYLGTGFKLATIQEDGSLRMDYKFSYMEMLGEQLVLRDKAKGLGFLCTSDNVDETKTEVERRMGLLKAYKERLELIEAEATPASGDIGDRE